MGRALADGLFAPDGFLGGGVCGELRLRDPCDGMQPLWPQGWARLQAPSQTLQSLTSVWGGPIDGSTGWRKWDHSQGVLEATAAHRTRSAGVWLNIKVRWRIHRRPQCQ